MTLTYPAPPDRNVSLELVRVTEAAAIAAARHQGRGDSEQVDRAAAKAMRPILQTVAMNGVAVVGKHGGGPTSFSLGQPVGDGSGPEVDVAVSGVDGAALVAKAMPDGISVIAVCGRGQMFDPGPCGYMRKLVVPRQAANLINPEAPVASIIPGVAKALGLRVGEFTVAVLDRPRHSRLVAAIRSAGARIKFLTDGEIAGAIMAVGDAELHTGVHMMIGTGGAQESVIAAAAIRCLGGEIFARLAPRNDDELRATLDLGHDLNAILKTADLVGGTDVFFAATGVTEGALLQGVRFGPTRIVTSSLSMRSRSGTIRYVQTHHDPERSSLASAQAGNSDRY